MKKSLGLLVLFFGFCSTCFATIPDSELSIGGIVLGNNPQHVQKIYGAPKKVKYFKENKYRKFVYGKSFFVEFQDQDAVMMKSTADNGLGTPSGVRVGSTVADVKRIYGNPDPLPARLSKKTNYLRYIGNQQSGELILKIKDGKVSEIIASAEIAP